MNGKRIVDDIATPSPTTLQKKALTPVTVSKNQDLRRKRTEAETVNPQTVKPKPMVINSPPRNIRMLKKPVEPVEVSIKFPEQQAPPATKDCAKSEDQPPDPIDPGRKEPIPTDADPVVKPAQSAVPKPDANFSAPPFWILGTLGGRTVGTYGLTDASRPFELMRVRCSYVLLNRYYLHWY